MLMIMTMITRARAMAMMTMVARAMMRVVARAMAMMTMLAMAMMTLVARAMAVMTLSRHLLGSRSWRPFDEAALQHCAATVHYFYVLLIRVLIIMMAIDVKMMIIL